MGPRRQCYATHEPKASKSLARRKCLAASLSQTYAGARLRAWDVLGTHRQECDGTIREAKSMLFARTPHAPRPGAQFSSSTPAVVVGTHVLGPHRFNKYQQSNPPLSPYRTLEPNVLVQGNKARACHSKHNEGRVLVGLVADDTRIRNH